MRTSTFLFSAMCLLSSISYAGSDAYSGKETKEVGPTCPQWYADREFNVAVWGTYGFSTFESDHNTVVASPRVVTTTRDLYLGEEAWGGGVDLKYFFHRYFGVGVEGWLVDARREFDDIDEIIAQGLSYGDHVLSGYARTRENNRALASVLGTLTLRYPISCSRFAPYVFVAGGGIFGGGETTRVMVRHLPFTQGVSRVRTLQSGSDAETLGQFGAGIEARLTAHIGWINDFSWNLVDGPNNNFGMFRTGVNFAF
jgi:hypothetical protein